MGYQTISATRETERSVRYGRRNTHPQQGVGLSGMQRRLGRVALLPQRLFDLRIGCILVTVVRTLPRTHGQTPRTDLGPRPLTVPWQASCSRITRRPADWAMRVKGW
ncbi:hypothetical protein BKI49_25135 [Streptomyces sp. Tue6028]|nr:hypothetical protein BKI49_25135 [Streptomyces sp. Tue6028]